MSLAVFRCVDNFYAVTKVSEMARRVYFVSNSAQYNRQYDAVACGRLVSQR